MSDNSQTRNLQTIAGTQKRQVTFVSKLEPQGQLSSYQSVLGLTRDKSIDSVASQGNSASKIYESRNTRKLHKKPSEFLDIDKVEKNRIRIERIQNVLETQFEKDRTNLERGLRTQVKGGTRAFRNASLGLGTNDSLKGGSSFNNQAMVGHKQGQMLERLKVMKSLADTDQKKSQLQVLQ